MFLGHYGAALAAKKAAPALPLGTLIMASQLMDLLWPLLLLFHAEHVRIAPGITAVTPLDFYDYPWSHSLTGSLLLSVLFGGGIYLLSKNPRSSAAGGVLVFSHWVLDFVTHRPDLPLTFGSGTKVGLGLWNSLPGTIVLELLVFLAGFAVYFASVPANRRKGTVEFTAFAAVLAGIYFASLFGPPPENSLEIAVAGNAAWIFVIWGYRLDRPRRKKPARL